MPSEESRKIGEEIAAVYIPTYKPAFLMLSEAIALALDEAKAERTEECARIAERRPEGVTPQTIAKAIRSLTQKDTPHNAE